MELTHDQKHAIERGEPIRLVIDQTECIVIRRDLFQQMKDSEDLSHQELRTFFARACESSDWNDPQMDAYDQYDAHRK